MTIEVVDVGKRTRVSLPWTPIVGERVATGLQRLEQAAGPVAVQKFMGGKVRGTQFSGRYLIGLTDLAAGRELIAELLEMLQQGQTIPLCNVATYYSHGKRWPLGMAIYEGRLVDVWADAEPDALLEAKP